MYMSLCLLLISKIIDYSLGRNSKNVKILENTEKFLNLKTIHYGLVTAYHISFYISVFQIYHGGHTKCLLTGENYV